MFKDRLGLQPDIVIRHPGGAPVIVETEFEPARMVEEDARSRLGLVIAEPGDAVEQAIAVRVPNELRGDQGRLAEAEFRYCVFTHHEGEPLDSGRWPESGWLSGGIGDLASLIEQAALSERRIARSIRILKEGVGQVAACLRSNLKDDRPDVLATLPGTSSGSPKEPGSGPLGVGAHRTSTASRASSPAGELSLAQCRSLKHRPWRG